MTTALTGWGRWPQVDAEVTHVQSVDQVRRTVATDPLTPRGLGRSYGDSAVGARVIDLTTMDNLLGFDDVTGLLTCQAGVSLAEILALFVPRGWFLPVTPGTRFVTVGGAVASDVHGKNHHVAGSFSDHVESFRLVTATGESLDVSRTDHADLFRATCGGMGLTGVITDVTFRLQRIGSRNIAETVVKAPDLAASLAAFDRFADTTFSVGWIDLCATGRRLGRSLVMAGEFTDDGDLAAVPREPSVTVPVTAPSWLLNRFTVTNFNRVYYHRFLRAETTHTVGIEPFFYPLDAIGGWNRLYGDRGFLQYQFVVPFGAGADALREAIHQISDSGLASPLAVLKVFGAGNDNHLSFPREGYTLAVDLQVGDRTLALCDRLDAIVTAAGGRVYLTKDSRMSRETFEAGYPLLGEFEDVRKRYGASGHFVSAQSRRLGLS